MTGKSETITLQLCHLTQIWSKSEHRHLYRYPIIYWINVLLECWYSSQPNIYTFLLKHNKQDRSLPRACGKRGNTACGMSLLRSFMSNNENIQEREEKGRFQWQSKILALCWQQDQGAVIGKSQPPYSVALLDIGTWHIQLPSKCTS